ncbi:MAG: relaxase domain-containing protein [Actinomycetia bacterium]|nr:relaxase domain-containing protein [Actinomycetes bacterium]
MHSRVREMVPAECEVAAMTARVITLKGGGAGEYYVEALPSYYLEPGEPAGLWHGHGAQLLGLHGEIDDDQFLRLMAGLDPHATGNSPLGRAYGETSVRGFDITASAPKSVSVLFAVGDDQTRNEVLAAHDTAVATMVRWVEAHAHTRFRINGDIAVVDVEGIVAATFRQHTSRVLDPQLHTHVVVANRVRSPDGRWLALDARTLKLDQRTLSAVYHSTLRSELTGRLGVGWREPVNGIAEMAGVADVVLEEFSTRTAGVQRRVDEKLDRFVDTFDRDPTPRERWQLEREAAIDSRPAKRHPTSAADLHQGWVAQLETLGHHPQGVVDRTIGQVRARALDPRVMDQTMARAVEVLSEKQSSWRPAELTREIAAALPTDVVVDGVDVVELLDGLTDLATSRHCVDISRPIPDGVPLRRDGRPTSESVADRALTTPEILAQEERLLAWAERRHTRVGVDSAHAPNRSPIELSGPQAQTAAAVAGDTDLVLVVGPAGTGKTTALAPAVAQLQADGRPVFGVTPSAAAADVLATETRVTADTLDKLLTEHNLNRPPDHRYDLPTGATVVVDEAAMVPTDRLDRLAQLADTKGWRVALIGDPMQFSAVGRGGMFSHLVDNHGAIELDQVHRFTQTWERDASLRLRRGDPGVADIYDAHGRLHGGTGTRMEAEALNAWWQARSSGESVLLAAPTNEAVARLNTATQQRRIDTGDLATRGRSTDVGDHRLWVGDEIVTRRNHRQLHTNRGLMIRNRDQWTIDQIHRNGDLTAHGPSGQVRLPADYVREHVELGYAQTSHATQGRTVDRSILVLDAPTDVRGLYVPMTRGRGHNDAYITTTGEHTAADVFAESVTRSWIDQPAHARQTELAGVNPHRPGTLPDHELRTLLDQKAQLAGTLTQLDDDLHWLPRDHQQTQREHHETTGRLTDDHERLQNAQDYLDRHDRPLRRRGHETGIANAHHDLEVLPGQIRDRQADIISLENRLQGLDRKLNRAENLNTQRPALETRLTDITTRLDGDTNIRSRQTRHHTPDRITNTLGNRPAGGTTAQAWDQAAGKLDQHQTAYGLTSGLGPQQGDKLPDGFLQSRGLAATAIRHLTQNGHQEQAIEHPGLGRSR